MIACVFSFHGFISGACTYTHAQAYYTQTTYVQTYTQTMTPPKKQVPTPRLVPRVRLAFHLQPSSLRLHDAGAYCDVFT